MKIKICGITIYEDARLALDLGADALGLNFYHGSPRAVSIEAASTIVARIPRDIWVVGIFCNHPRAEIENIARFVRLNTLQFHGDEDIDFCKGWSEWRLIKALRLPSAADVANASDYAAVAPFLLFDSYFADRYGGTGEVIPSEIGRSLRAQNLFARGFLSGGLTPANVASAIELYRPFGVDVASGVESAPGVKSATLLREFIAIARRAEKNTACPTA